LQTPRNFVSDMDSYNSDLDMDPYIDSDMDSDTDLVCQAYKPSRKRRPKPELPCLPGIGPGSAF
jgi:hypothetical protein